MRVKLLPRKTIFEGEGKDQVRYGDEQIIDVPDADGASYIAQKVAVEVTEEVKGKEKKEDEEGDTKEGQDKAMGKDKGAPIVPTETAASKKRKRRKGG
jgi:hypothetical protein